MAADRTHADGSMAGPGEPDQPGSARTRPASPRASDKPARSVMRPLRLLCHGAVAAVGSAVLLTGTIVKAGVCPRFDEAAIHCTSPVFEALGSYAMTVLLLAVFGFPLSLPLLGGGVLFMIADAWRWGRSRRGGDRPKSGPDP